MTVEPKMVNALLVELAAGGSPWKLAVRVASITNITLAGVQTIDGVLVAIEDRVAVLGQTNPAENGIYDVASAAWTRSADFNDSPYVPVGTCFLVMEGSLRARHFIEMTSPTSGSVRLGLTPLVFTDRGTFVGGTEAATPSSIVQRDSAAKVHAAGLVSDQTTLVCQPANRSTAGIGYGATFAAGKANGSNVGGVTKIGDDNGGTPGTNLAGSIDFWGGTTVANAAAKTRWVSGVAGAFELANAGQSAATTFQLAGGNGVTVEIKSTGVAGVSIWAPSTGILRLGMDSGGTAQSNQVQIGAGAGGLIQTFAPELFHNHTTIYDRDAGGTEKRRTTVATAVVVNIASGGSQDTQVNGSSRMFCDANGVQINGQVRYNAVITPAAIGTTQLLYQPANILTSRRVNQDVSAACIIQTIIAGTDGQRITLRNHSNTPANTLTLLADDGATGTAANRIRCPNNANLVIRCNGAVELEYCGAISRWTVIAP